MMGSREIGVYGLGKMGKNIALNMLNKGYKVLAYNRSPGPIEEVAAKGASKASSINDFKKLSKPRLVWLMLPAGEVTDNAVKELSQILEKGDILVDGANSMYKDSMRHNEILTAKGIKFIDAGCSGGPSGALNGMSMMIGGDKETFKELEQLFKELSVPNGYSYIGPAGSGHFVKMVHNAIEYGMMQSIAEGVELVQNGPYKGLDLAEVCRVWCNGSVIRGYLIELTQRALSKDPDLSEVLPYVEDNGEGRWAVNTAIEYAIPFTGIAGSVFERFSSRSEKRFSNRVLAALRHEFGGHDIKKGE